jgi:hypothetical protein
VIRNEGRSLEMNASGKKQKTNKKIMSTFPKAYSYFNLDVVH